MELINKEVTVYNVNPKGYYKKKNDSRKEAYQPMELYNGLMTVKVNTHSCMSIRYMDTEEVENTEGYKLINWDYPVEDNRDLLGWYYHENSDTIFIGKLNDKFGNEDWFVYFLGACKEGTELELMEVLCSHKHWENQDITKYTIDYNKPEIN
jgi:hypothetical protein